MDPIIKWAGGKGKLIPHLSKFITKESLQGHRYYEPFAGSGAFALYLEHPDTVLNDKNWELYNLYIEVRDEPEKLLKIMEEHQVNMEKSPEWAKMWFGVIRNLDRGTDWPYLAKDAIAGRTIFLNKTGFNGLYRVNKKGYFNVPLGRTITGKVPDLVQREKIMKLHEFLRSVDLRNTDFSEAVSDAKAGDVVYFDPPYDKPEEDPTEFTMYHKDGFTRDDLVRLKQTCDDLVARGCTVVVSNNDTEFVRELFKDYNFYGVETLRSINPKSKTRCFGKELIIYMLN